MPETKDEFVWVVTEDLKIVGTSPKLKTLMEEATPEGCVGFFAIFNDFDAAACFAKDLNNVQCYRMKKKEEK